MVFPSESLPVFFGVAEKVLLKMKAGFVTQSKAMDNLLRVIGEFPESFRIFKAKAIK
ncbi:MAG: hypothetical protein MW689_000688 [Thermodesulfobacteria bacterium]|nr:hypothetical protein [Thermodesulfobacteriota bacterium]